MRRADVLATIADAEDLYGSLVTTVRCRRRDVLRAVRAGLVRSIGLVRVVDEDRSPILPERWREGFVLTENGRMLL
jgi:hypothetical protein